MMMLRCAPSLVLLLLVGLVGFPSFVAAQPRPAPPRKRPARPSGPDLPSRMPLTAPAATVNGEAIPLAAYLDRLSLRFGPDVRESLIQDALIRQEAKRRKITATPAEIAETVTRAYGKTVANAGDEKKLAEDLSRARGWTLDDYRAVIRIEAMSQVLREKLTAALVPPAAIKLEEIEERYAQQRQAFTQPDRVRISHILVRRPPNADEDADRKSRTRAEGLLKQVLDGGSFEELARKHSEDNATVNRGGRLPVDVVRGANPFGAAFEAAVFSAPVGVLKQVIAAPDGYHVIRLDEVKPGGILPLAQVKEQIRSALLFERRGRAMEELLLRLRGEAKVDTRKF